MPREAEPRPAPPQGAVDSFRTGIEFLVKQIVQPTGTDSTRIQSIAGHFAEGIQELICVVRFGPLDNVDLEGLTLDDFEFDILEGLEDQPPAQDARTPQPERRILTDDSRSPPAQDARTPQPEPPRISTQVKKTPPSERSAAIKRRFFLETFTGESEEGPGYHWIHDLKQEPQEQPNPVVDAWYKEAPPANCTLQEFHNKCWKEKKQGDFRTILITELDKKLHGGQDGLNVDDLKRLGSGDQLDTVLYEKVDDSISSFKPGFKKLLKALERYTWYGANKIDLAWENITKQLEEEDLTRVRMTPQAVLFVEDCVQHMVSYEQGVYLNARGLFPRDWGTKSPIGIIRQPEEREARRTDYSQRLVKLKEANICLKTEVYKRVSES